MASGWRFYIRRTASGEEKFAVNSSVDSDGDQRLTVITSTDGRGLEIIEELMKSFYENGPLNGGFFDIQYNFLKRHQKTNELMAWNPHIKKALERDVLNSIEVMPILKEKGLPNSRGIILSGPPGTGKTMIAKSIASETEVTTILISAEMIQQRNDIKSAFRLARKLAPTLIIIEDIDTAGTVSRRFADHPILGEYLQAMDGIEANEGVVVLATTNHTENIDPAISDRPGRFDRIIEVPLPDREQRINILANLLAKMPTENITFGLGTMDYFGNETIAEIGRDAKHLSGAWIREIVHTAFIFATYDGRDAISAEDLRAALEDVKERRGLAYKSTPKLEHNYLENNSDVNDLFI
jgi:ATP-dependent 26S proteasome regulatory subunit